jgi:hypothetical protein
MLRTTRKGWAYSRAQGSALDFHSRLEATQSAKNSQTLTRVSLQHNDSLTVRSSTILLNRISNLGRTAILGCAGVVGEVGLESEILFEFWASSSEDGAAESMASFRMRGVRRAASGSKLIAVGRNNDAMITRCFWRVAVDMAGWWEVGLRGTPLGIYGKLKAAYKS